MSKQQAYDKLFNEYVNKNGHVTLKRAVFSRPENGDFDSENPNLFTGQAGILCHLNGLPINKFTTNAAKSVQSVMVLDKDGNEIKGLFSRQPGSYKSNNPVSHDEYSGICFTSSVIPQFRNSIASDIVEYGKEYNYCYDDTNPRVKPVTRLFRDPLMWLTVAKAFKSKDREKYPIINTLTHRRQPDEVAYYKMISNKHKPSLFGIIYFALSLFFSVRKPKGSTSGKIINWYKLKSLEIIGYDHMLITPFKKYYLNRLKKDYGNDYVNALHGIYYRDRGHPFHELTKGLR